MTDPDQVELARRAAAGERTALDLLWRLHRRFAAAVLLAHLPRGADLEDLLQEVAVSVCEHIRELREPERFLPWLRSIALNRARSAARRESLRARATASFDALPAEPADPAARAAEATRAAAARALELARRLDPDYGEPLILKCVRGLSQRQIAGLLGLSEAAVETRLARARRMLRRELEQEEAALPARRACAPRTSAADRAEA